MFFFHSAVCMCRPLKHSNVLGRASAKMVEPVDVRQEAESGSEDPVETRQCPRHFQTPGPDMETSVQGTELK